MRTKTIISADLQKGKQQVDTQTAAKHKVKQAEWMEAFIDNCASQERISNNTDDLREKLADARRDYILARRAYDSSRGINIAQRLETQLNRLANGSIDLVEGIAFNGDGLRVQVLTKPIICTDPKDGERYLLGRFKMDFNLDHDFYDNWETDVLLINLDREVDGYGAPHVESNGTVCFGNVNDHLVEYLGACQLEAAVTLCLNFLQTRNLDDSSGNCLVNFPKYKARRVVARRKTRKVAKRPNKRRH